MTGKQGSSTSDNQSAITRRSLLVASTALAATAAALPAVRTASAQQSTAPSGGEAKPNILVIWGDDIGTWNISHNNRGIEESLRDLGN